MLSVFFSCSSILCALIYKGGGMWKRKKPPETRIGVGTLISEGKGIGFRRGGCFSK